MEIKIYNNELKRKGVIENHTSLIWTRKYFEPGDFELHCPLTEANLNLLVKGNIVAKEDTVESGVIESVIITEGSDIKTIVASGRFMSSYFDRRLIQATYSFNGKTEIAMRNIVGYINPIPLVVLGTLKGFTETVTFQATMKESLSILTKLSKSSGIGFRLVPDFVNKALYFEAYKGTDRSVSQSDNNRVIFSEQYDNLNQVKYTTNDQIYKTVVVVGGEGEGSARTYVTVGEGTGLELREIFVDAKDIRSDDFGSTSEYLNALRQKGYEALKAHQIVNSFEYETNPDANFIYKKDYDLGDVVTVRKRDWNVKEDLRITEIQEVYEDGGMTVVPTLGSALPDTVTWED